MIYQPSPRLFPVTGTEKSSISLSRSCNRTSRLTGQSHVGDTAVWYKDAETLRNSLDIMSLGYKQSSHRSEQYISILDTRHLRRYLRPNLTISYRYSDRSVQYIWPVATAYVALRLLTDRDRNTDGASQLDRAL
jgi:hypothetical protein